MKKLKQLSFAVGVAVLLGLVPLRPAFAGGTIFNDNVQVQCSTTTPTLVSAACNDCIRTTIINANTDYILLAATNTLTSFSNSISTGTARIVSGSYSPDGNGSTQRDAFTGQLYCLGSSSAAASAVTIQVIRTK